MRPSAAELLLFWKDAYLPSISFALWSPYHFLPLPTTSYHLSPHLHHLPHRLPASLCTICLPHLPPPRTSFIYLPCLPFSSTSPNYLLQPPPPSTSTILLHLLPPSTSPSYFRQPTCTSPIYLLHPPSPSTSTICLLHTHPLNLFV